VDTDSGLVALGTVIADDSDDLVEQRRAFPTLRADKLGLDGRTVRRVAGEEKLLPPSDRRLVAECGPGLLRAKPSQDPTVVGCPEASAEDVVEGVRVPSPRVVALWLM
jgi:hypothetical protein